MLKLGGAEVCSGLLVAPRRSILKCFSSDKGDLWSWWFKGFEICWSYGIGLYMYKLEVYVY